MKIFPVPFSIANEAVKRSQNDNRRLIESPKSGGNDFFYLGSSNQFLNKLDLSLRQKLIEVKNSCDELFKNPSNSRRTLQRGQGIKVVHKIKKELLLSLIPFLKSYLQNYGFLYHNANPNIDELAKRVNCIQGDFVEFFSDLIFIRDSNNTKPYFKWFNYPDSKVNFKLVQEFFIPRQSFLNFELENYIDEKIYVTWELSYTMHVMCTSENIEAIISNAIENIPINDSDISTIKEAITKIRIGQSKFRDDLLKSKNNSCLITGISNSSLLIASHIKPWKDSNDHERLDINNGILLTPTFDKLFDKFLITFDADGKVIWSKKRLDKDSIDKIILGHPQLSNLSIPINDKNRTYLEFHRDVFRIKESSN